MEWPDREAGPVSTIYYTTSPHSVSSIFSLFAQSFPSLLLLMAEIICPWTYFPVWSFYYQLLSFSFNSNNVAYV